MEKEKVGGGKVVEEELQGEGRVREKGTIRQRSKRKVRGERRTKSTDVPSLFTYSSIFLVSFSFP